MKKICIWGLILFVLLGARCAYAAAFEIHFIDVGHGDAALVICDDQTMLIDGGSSEKSSLIYSYLKNHGILHLDYIIATHAHEDHIGGLAGALNFATVCTAYCPVTSYDSKEFLFLDKYLAEQNVSITVPVAGESFALGSASIEILAPIKELNKHNDNSIVLRIVYGDTSFLFTGDAEKEEERSILNAGYAIQSTVLKVGHHGRDTSTTSSFLDAISPEYAVISAGKNNQDGYSMNDTFVSLGYAGVQVFRTDTQGTIICTSDGKNVSFTTEKNQDEDGLPVTPEENVEVKPYILNTNTMKFHFSTCRSAKQIQEKNKSEHTGSREELIEKGYSPCGNCKP